MKILYYDCFSGISGDMNLGAMIDLGVDKEYLLKELEKLNVHGYKIQITRDERKGITGTKVKVWLEDETHDHHHENSHHHDDNSEHNHDHHHDHHHQHFHEQHVHNHEDGDHQHRNLKDIEDIINSSSLNDRVKELSLKIFLKVAEAEAKIHGKSLMDVHFHEVGALDSIVDIIGSAICLDYLKVDKVMSASVELGGGFVKCAHGLFPVPAPATAEILKGIPVKLGAVQVETTTPTGAAILAATVDEFTDKKEFTINKVSYGIGHRDTVIPNVLRVYLGEIENTASNGFTGDEAYVIECNIDDMNPEIYEYIMEKLFAIGAMDVFMNPIIMKKGRPGIKLSVLCNKNLEMKVIDILLRETTTLGVRKYCVEKTMLNRKFSKVNTKHGEVTVKISLLNEEEIKYKPEYSDCKKLALEKNVHIGEIYSEVNKQMNNK
jgi:uncharacterized protein (TIGR00299 family) protein